MQLLLELSHDVAPGLGRGAAALVMPGPPLRLYCRVPPLRLQLPGAATPPLTRFLQAAAALAPIEAGPSEPECPQPPPPSCVSGTASFLRAACRGAHRGRAAPRAKVEYNKRR